METFIKTFEDVVSEDKCQQIINYIDECEEAALKGEFYGEVDWGHSLTSNKSKLNREDFQVHLDISHELSKEVSEIMYYYLKEYMEYYYMISSNYDYDLLRISGIKLQKTPIRGGFHTWHCETGWNRQTLGLVDRISSNNRAFTWAIYLNDIDDGGETEFINQHLKLKSVRGNVCIFPAWFTHTHRGNPPYSGNKYIITGWFDTHTPEEMELEE
jgi:hypothetical protein